ncbi:hypothetical protein H9P43_008186 [Blastocladiella emersonii ATCC 22665]|nr:hypothetical protein H9P43_008175 [Blastocladiella emersonii ATCC 22665]KAI9164348.1 hypothetical protein H9P43_008186 [Blastocladiella emersonii ATCC 22665]
MTVQLRQVLKLKAGAKFAKTLLLTSPKLNKVKFTNFALVAYDWPSRAPWRNKGFRQEYI